MILYSALVAPVTGSQPGALMNWGGVNWTKEQVATLTNITMASSASVHFGAALTAEGTVRVFGSTDVTKEGMSNIVDIAGGPAHLLALKSDGTMMARGDSLLGLNSVPTTSPGNVMDVTANNMANFALLRDATVYSLGPGAKEVPIQDGVAISAGWSFCLALRENGMVFGWGQDDVGQLQIPAGLSNVTHIAAGAAHSLALKSDGTVVAWGSSKEGQCKVPPGLSNVGSIGAGTFHSIALKRDGTAVAWGANDFGQADAPPLYNDLIDVFATPVGALGITRLPILMAQPSDTTIHASSDVSLAVEAIGYGGVAYQCSKTGRFWRDAQLNFADWTLTSATLPSQATATP